MRKGTRVHRVAYELHKQWGQGNRRGLSKGSKNFGFLGMGGD